ncbi:hypothetical protein DBIPINDM_004974 [Mesorhizobium sp. AR02]|uniref:hypothetical protein n=1 Tax=Mesorhizobium sp. AR02 TaxID=2865837 RepID=UPI00215E304C|nr:hypothetical protein [Mesorhizobium sp. AR02]UVK51676.1 hypothetical protein DBIPINDM_004974 [Mesorhizobium sp. AR02]
MRVFWFAALNFVTMLLAMPSVACVMQAERDLHDIKYADVVVVGRIVNYQIVRDPIARQRYRDMLARSPKLREVMPKEPRGFMTDYARFDIVVDEVLRGKAPDRLAATWDNSTFGEVEDMGPDMFLIALRDPKSPIPPLRGPSATVASNPAPATLTVLQAPCASPFIFESSSKEAAELRRILGQRAE